MNKSTFGGDMAATIDFLHQLESNNNRPWFKERKVLFDDLRAHWLLRLQQLIDHMAEWEPGLRGLQAKQATYRIYRDTRFSPDKTPYKTYFSASMSASHDNTHHCGYYFELGARPDFCGTYGGVWCPDSPTLAKLRRAIVDNSEEWLDIVNNPQLQSLYPGWCGNSLKTIPKGYDRNHPMAEYLRLKDIGKYHRLTPTDFNDPCWPEMVSDLMRPLKPLVDFLDYSIHEEV